MFGNIRFYWYQQLSYSVLESSHRQTLRQGDVVGTTSYTSGRIAGLLLTRLFHVKGQRYLLS